MDKVVFLDRDGTINEEVHYLYRPEDFKFLPGVPEALKMLTDSGYKLVVGISRIIKPFPARSASPL